MAVTPNLNLYKPDGEDYVSLSRDLNENYDKIDAAVGSNSDAIANLQSGLAYIVGNTNATGVSLAVGQYVYVKGHSTIAEGLRKVTSSISNGGSITTNNTEACSEGGLNALNSKITNITYNVINPLNGYFTKRDAFRAKIRCGVAIVESYINFTTEIPANTEFASIETTGIYGSYIAINTSTRDVYYVSLRSTGRFASETAIPTGYYYVVGCAI